MMSNIDPGWWVIITAAILGVFGALVAVIMKRPDIILPNSKSKGEKGDKGDPGVDIHSLYIVPGLADACKIEAEKIDCLQMSYKAMAGKIERIDEKMVDTRQYMVGVHEQLVDTKKDLLSIRSDIESGFKDLKHEIRKDRAGDGDSS